MTDDQNRSAHSDAYRAAREQFDQLRIEERAQFLVEAMLVTIGRGLETAGETISREMDGALSSVRETVREATDAMRAAADRASEQAHRTPGAAEGAAPDADGGAPWEEANDEPPAAPGA